MIGTEPYRLNDFDPHVPGLTGYVWPGGGSSAYKVSPMSLPPGYQSPWSSNPPGALPSWYQERGNNYAPFGAILTSTENYQITLEI